jgi:hypothetical protein
MFSRCLNYLHSPSAYHRVWFWEIHKYSRNMNSGCIWKCKEPYWHTMLEPITAMKTRRELHACSTWITHAMNKSVAEHHLEPGTSLPFHRTFQVQQIVHTTTIRKLQKVYNMEEEVRCSSLKSLIYRWSQTCQRWLIDYWVQVVVYFIRQHADHFVALNLR